MAMRIVNVLATKGDLVRFANDFERGLSLKYVRSGVQENEPGRVEYNSMLDIPRLGTAKCDMKIGLDRYLIVDADTRVVSRAERFPAYINWYLDYERMPDAVEVFLPGTLPRNHVLITGEFIAASQSREAKRLIRRVRDALKLSFTRRGNGLIGPDAWMLAQSGWRCCTSVSSPREYDISLA
jgi:hypothetical protein